MTEKEILEARTYNAAILTEIRKRCIVKHTSVPKIEKALGYGNGSISGWAKAKRKAPRDRIAAVAAFLDCSVADLERTNERPAPTNEDGQSNTQQELIRLLPYLTDQELAVLLTTTKALIASRKSPGDS